MREPPPSTAFTYEGRIGQALPEWRAWPAVREATELPDYQWKGMRTTFSTRLTDHDPRCSPRSFPGQKGHSEVRQATWDKKVEAISRLPRLPGDSDGTSSEGQCLGGDGSPVWSGGTQSAHLEGQEDSQGEPPRRRVPVVSGTPVGQAWQPNIRPFGIVFRE